MFGTCSMCVGGGGNVKYIQNFDWKTYLEGHVCRDLGIEV